MNLTRNIFITIAIGFMGGQVVYAAENSSTSYSNSKHSAKAGAASDEASKSNGEKVQFSQLPQAVQKAMRAVAPGVNIEHTQKISMNGQTCYRGTFDRARMKGRLTVAEDGSLLQYQESAGVAMIESAPDLSARGKSEMQLSQLPQPVQNTVKQHAGSNQVGDIFKTTDTESGKTAYHVSFDDGAALTDLLLDAEGNVLYRADQTALYAAPLEDSKTLSLQSAPQSVQKAIRGQGLSAQNVSDIDKGTWNGQTVYKVMIEKNGSYRPLLVSENGQILKPGSGNDRAAGSAASHEQGASFHAKTKSKSSNSGEK